MARMTRRSRAASSAASAGDAACAAPALDVGAPARARARRPPRRRHRHGRRRMGGLAALRRPSHRVHVRRRAAVAALGRRVPRGRRRRARGRGNGADSHQTARRRHGRGRRDRRVRIDGVRHAETHRAVGTLHQWRQHLLAPLGRDLDHAHDHRCQLHLRRVQVPRGLQKQRRHGDERSSDPARPAAADHHPAAVLAGGTEGETAVFSSTAAGKPAPTEQWELSTDGGSTWSPIEGATSTTLTVPETTLAESGWQYRAVFTNDVG